MQPPKIHAHFDIYSAKYACWCDKHQIIYAPAGRQVDGMGVRITSTVFIVFRL
jgi:hypothetical protein